jgi:hypothetical protein
MITTAEPAWHNWKIPLLAVAFLLAIMLGIELALPKSSAAIEAATISGSATVGSVQAAQAGTGPLQHTALAPDSNCDLEWRLVSSPDPEGEVRGHLDDVAAVSANNMWAVGTFNWRTLIKHWDGVRWSIVLSPNQSTRSQHLTAVSVVSANDVWAVGSYERVDTTLPSSTLILHWDGSIWSVVPSPNGGAGDNSLSDVAAVSANDVWAVGT